MWTSVSEWTILNHINCFIQGEVIGFQVCWIVFIHIVRGRPGGLLQFTKAEAIKTWHLFHLVFAQCGEIGRNVGDSELSNTLTLLCQRLSVYKAFISHVSR